MCRIASSRCAVALSAALASFAHAEPPERYPLARDLPAFEAPDSPSASADSSFSEPSGDLALGDALALALLRNPELAVDSYEQRAREAAALQARVRPNPTLSLELEDFAGSGSFRGVRQAQTTLLLGQLVELGGKRAARVTLARAQVDVAAWDYELRRIDVLSRTSDAFIELLAAQQRLELADDALALARAVERVAGLRRRAGMASPAEEIRAGVAADIAGVEREHTQHELATARQALAAMWAGEASFARALGDLEQLPKPPRRAELANRLDASPGVARWQAELARREAARSVVRSERTPDLAVRAGPRHLAGADDVALVVGVSVPLPLFDRKAGAIAESEQRIAKLAAEQRAERVRVATALNAAQLALIASLEEAKLLRERVLPGIERAAQVMQRGYEEGRFAQIEVLETERARALAREQTLRALVEAHHNAREIERLTGVALEVLP
jgi:cobalt-zinc-cadmium efflux system outer membrane protein